MINDRLPLGHLITEIAHLIFVCLIDREIDRNLFIRTPLNLHKNKMKVTIPKPIPGEEHKKIEVDDWDIWNVDYTLACVIHPGLLKYRENLTGYPELWEDGMITSHNYDRQLHFDIFDEKV